MISDRDFEGIATAWLAQGPEELSDRVLAAVADEIHLTRQRRPLGMPWRDQRMNQPVRIAAAAVIGVLVIGGFVFLSRPDQSGVGGPGPSPSPSPSASPTTSRPPSPTPLPALTKLFTSSRHGYSVRVPADWAATDATAPWTAGIDTFYDDPGLDRLGKVNEARLAIASHALAAGQTPEEWLAPFCRSGTTGTDCGREVRIGDQVGLMDEDGVSAEGGAVATDGVMYGAAIVVGGRGYTFILNGHVDQAMFDALMATVTFDPTAAIDGPAGSSSPS